MQLAKAYAELSLKCTLKMPSAGGMTTTRVLAAESLRSVIVCCSLCPGTNARKCSSAGSHVTEAVRPVASNGPAWPHVTCHCRCASCKLLSSCGPALELRCYGTSTTHCYVPGGSMGDLMAPWMQRLDVQRCDPAFKRQSIATGKGYCSCTAAAHSQLGAVCTPQDPASAILQSMCTKMKCQSLQFQCPSLWIAYGQQHVVHGGLKSSCDAVMASETTSPL